MLHESIISRTASSEISQVKNTEKIDLTAKLKEIRSTIDVVENPIPYTLQTITIAHSEDDKYYVDFESFINYINVNDTNAHDTWKALEEEYDIDSDDMYLVLPCKEKLMDAIDEIDCSTSIAKHKCCNSIAKMLIMIQNIKDEGIKMVISDY